MITKKFGFWTLLGVSIGALIFSQWYAPLIFITAFLYDAIKPEDK